MGKKKKTSSNLGRTLIKDRFGGTTNKRMSGDSLLHTAEINDGYEWGRLNLQSVTEESSFQEFLSTAELAGTEFQAEKLNITFVTATSGLLSKTERAKKEAEHEENKSLLRIPRRPKWDLRTTAEELQEQERTSFLQWRHGLAVLQEEKGLLLTPYEKNLEFWRQLWRVVERSDVLVQILDARNPLLFRCEDLEEYVQEVDPLKLNMLLLNKADFLTDAQRDTWTDYFNKQGIRVAFFSAVLEDEKDEASTTEDEGKQGDTAESSDEEEETDAEQEARRQRDHNAPPDLINTAELTPPCDDDVSPKEQSMVGEDSKLLLKQGEENKKPVESAAEPAALPAAKPAALPAALKTEENVAKCSDDTETAQANASGLPFVNSSRLLSRQELIDLFKSLSSDDKPCTCIGLVGYPNVGKSSTINALLQQKKVSVSTTPGKTKHFQTLFLEPSLMLCDCPGLVMPSYVCTKADMVVNGILPVDQLRDSVPPIAQVASFIPRHVLEDRYGIMLPPPREGEDPNRDPTPEELLSAYGYNRGFMTQRGLPDNSRAARCVLKDFVMGKLLFCTAPPDYNQEEFHTFPPRSKPVPEGPPPQLRVVRPHRISTETLDKNFFTKASIAAVHVKGQLPVPGVPTSVSSEATAGGSTDRLAAKPWKHHNNKNKREKTRRLYSHLDQL